ncbi:MAG: tyrosine-type recombinase/integrase [Nitrospira sp.]|nr:tyrosine-type recombinase/integrase [Nitrospira sp.]
MKSREAQFKEIHKVRAIHEPHVFLHGGCQILSIKVVLKAACKGARIANFRFHDFRHTAITNMRQAGIDMQTIMQVSAQ